MKIIAVALLIVLTLINVGCSNKTSVVEDITVTDLRLMLNEDYQFLDVRTAEEYNEYHIPEFSNIDYYQFSLDESMLENLDKEQPIVLICRSGNRSAKAAELLEGLGFTKVYNVTGGMNTW